MFTRRKVYTNELFIARWCILILIIIVKTMSIREQLLVVVVFYSQLRWFIVQFLTISVGVAILLSASVFLYGSFYYWYMPSVLHERPVHFTFRLATHISGCRKSCV